MAREPLLTLDELCTQVSLALSVDYDGAPNDRVRHVPDRRSIRYYTTLGMIDRPARMRGRTALYGRRHLLQLVAIKRLQSRGRSLQEVQQQLAGMTNAELEKLARVPELPERPPPENEPAEPKRRVGFWRNMPAPAATPSEADPPAAVVVQGLPLSDEVLLLLPLRRAPDESDLEAARVAAAPLLRLLEVRRLI